MQLKARSYVRTVLGVLLLASSSTSSVSSPKIVFELQISVGTTCLARHIMASS
jgi:hypothetical protein